MKKYFRAGITMVELMMTILISTIVVVGIGVAMVDGQKSYSLMSERTQGDVVTDAYVAKATFSRICRKASIMRCLPLIGDMGSFAEVYYYNDSNSLSPDRYAAFRVNGGSLLADYGTYVSSTKNKTLLATQTLARNVNSAQFAVQGSSVIMTLSLLKGNQAITLTCSSVRHNE